MIIYKLSDIPKNVYDSIGTRAKGLRELIRAGLNVPEGFVVADIKRGEDFPFAVDYYSRSGLKSVAVRPSPVSEESGDFSTAGQFETFLNVSDKGKLLIAIKKCIESLKNYMAKNYCDYFGGTGNRSAAVVIQGMVEAKYSGVCFSKNPINAKSEIVIESVRGLGASLLAGKAKSRKYTASYTEADNKIVELEPVTLGEGAKMLSCQEVTALCKDVIKAVDYFGYPLNMEWVIDKSGNIYWLQARRITTLDIAAIDELDTEFEDNQSVFVALKGDDILPKVATPLSLSTTINGLDYALRTMLVKAGAFGRLKSTTAGTCITSSSGHIFFNLSSFYRMTQSIGTVKKLYLDNFIYGKGVDVPDVSSSKKNALIRAKNHIVYAQFYMSRNKVMKRMESLVETFRIEPSKDPTEYYKNIHAKIDYLNKASIYYCIATTHYAMMNGALSKMAIAAYSTEEEVANALSVIYSDVEGYSNIDVHNALRKIAIEVVRQYPAAADFSRDRLIDIINKDTRLIRAEYNTFVARFGHRSSCEAEISSPSWKNDEQSLADSILNVIRTDIEPPQSQAAKQDLVKKKLIRTKKLPFKPIAKYIINQARLGYYGRENTKSKYIMIVDAFKDAYKKLAQLMVERRIIRDANLIYFLTHEEIGRLLIKKQLGLIKRAMQRQKHYVRQNMLDFAEINVGKPKPLEPTVCSSSIEQVLSGVAISRGDAVGVARVVGNAADAKNLLKGEIMVADYADTAWSQYFSLINGLVTEVGSAVSHGAIVAREYGLPLVANVPDATKTIKTGDSIRLDGNKVIVVSENPS